MNDKRLVANVYDSGDSVACVERGRGTGYVLDRPVIVTMFDFLKNHLIFLLVYLFSKNCHSSFDVDVKFSVMLHNNITVYAST